MFRVTLGARGFFSCCLRQKLSDKAVIITIAASPLNFCRKQLGKKTLWHPGYFRVRGTDQKIQKCRKARTLPWSARDFSSAVSGFCQVKASPLVASAYGRRCVDLRPTPKIPENSRRTREKPLVPRVSERLLFAQTKGGKMLHVAYRD